MDEPTPRKILCGQLLRNPLCPPDAELELCEVDPREAHETRLDEADLTAW